MDAHRETAAAARITRQRNVLSLYLGLSLLCNLGQVAERILNGTVAMVTPSIISGEYRRQGDRVNALYISDHAQDVLLTALNITPETADYSKKQVLAMTDQQSYGSLDRDLTTRNDLIKARKMTTSFAPAGAKASAKNLVAVVEGMYSEYVGTKRITHEQRRYLVRWKFNGTQFKLDTFKEVTKDA
jgi:type IV conjugative transfer system protein TraE